LVIPLPCLWIASVARSFVRLRVEHVRRDDAHDQEERDGYYNHPITLPITPTMKPAKKQMAKTLMG
jgi:hypothetical protein